jgi:glycosyltransferase involved in cell wall biosynthesis
MTTTAPDKTASTVDATAPGARSMTGAQRTDRLGLATSQLHPTVTGSVDRPVVLHLLHTLQRGGAEVLVRDLVSDLSESFEFVVVSLDEAGPIAEELSARGVAVHTLGRRPGLDWRCGWRLARLARRYGARVIHAHQYTPLFYATMARMVCGRTLRLLFTEHGRHYPDERRFKRVLANRLLINRRVDCFTAVGQFVRQALIENEAMPASRIQVVYNGVDTARSLNRPDNGAARARLCGQLKLPVDTPLIMQVAGLRSVKDHQTAVAALRRLHDQGCRAHLVLVGDGSMRNQIVAAAGRCGVHSAVHLLGWRDDVDQLWQAVDVGLLTSLSEGISVAILEAMLAGKPVVATDVGGNGELIQHGVTGLLAPRGHVKTVAEALHQLLDSPSLRARLGSAGRRRAIDQFSQSAMHQAYRRIYREMTDAQT